MIKTKNGIPIATNFVRVIRVGVWDFVEFTKDQIILKNISIPHDKYWRLSEKWKDKVYYILYRTTDNIRVYYQKQLFKYGDHKLNHFYIALENLEENIMYGKVIKID